MARVNSDIPLHLELAIPADLYRDLATIARTNGTSVREVLHDAARDLVQRHKAGMSVRAVLSPPTFVPMTAEEALRRLDEGMADLVRE